jgi:hypothetical protein
LPEEIIIENNNSNKENSTISTFGTEGTNGTNGYKSPKVPLVLSTEGTNGQLLENKPTYSANNTSLKTNTKSDDEAFATLTELFRKSVRKSFR